MQEVLTCERVVEENVVKIEISLIIPPNTEDLSNQDLMTPPRINIEKVKNNISSLLVQKFGEVFEVGDPIQINNTFCLPIIIKELPSDLSEVIEFIKNTYKPFLQSLRVLFSGIDIDYYIRNGEDLVIAYIAPEELSTKKRVGLIACSNSKIRLIVNLDYNFVIKFLKGLKIERISILTNKMFDNCKSLVYPVTNKTLETKLIIEYNDKKDMKRFIILSNRDKAKRIINGIIFKLISSTDLLNGNIEFSCSLDGNRPTIHIKLNDKQALIHIENLLKSEKSINIEENYVNNPFFGTYL